MMRLLQKDQTRVESRLAWRLAVAGIVVAVLAIVTLGSLER